MQRVLITDGKNVCADLIRRALTASYPDAGSVALVLDRPKDARHGDYACNVALQLARSLKLPPREIATTIAAAMPSSPFVEKAEVAGAGFINVFLKQTFKQTVVNQVLELEARYGTHDFGAGKRTQVEFVSANPTGPLHVGHGRGAAFGASLANVLQAVGFDVEREYYVNDAGRQMDILALSTWLRYLEHVGETVPFPANAYQGDYVRTMAATLFKMQGARYSRPAAEVLRELPSADDDAEAHLDALIVRAKTLLGTDYERIHAYAMQEQLADCREDLTEFGVVFDNWYSERSLYGSGLLARTLAQLRESGHV